LSLIINQFYFSNAIYYHIKKRQNAPYFRKKTSEKMDKYFFSGLFSEKVLKNIFYLL